MWRYVLVIIDAIMPIVLIILTIFALLYSYLRITGQIP